MADKKISALSAASALAGTETFPAVQSSSTKKATIDQIVTYAIAAMKGVSIWSDPAKLASDLSNATTTPANASGVSFSGAANTSYEVLVTGTVTADAATTGIGLDLDIPSGSVTGLGFHATSVNGGINSFEQIADGASSGVSSGFRAASTVVPFRAFFVVDIGATPGTVQLQFRPELAANATLKAGTRLFYRKLAS